MAPEGTGRFQETFEEKIYGHSLNVIFFYRSCIKMWTEAEKSYVMLAQLKRHLEVYGGGQTMVEKTDWKTHVQL